MYTLTIRFKKGTQEISFQRKPVIHVENSGGCTVWVNGKRYVWFCVPCEGWG